MDLLLDRWKFSNKSTIGSLYVDGAFQCYTIEDFDRGLLQSMEIDEITRKKVYGTTCIPYGSYRIIITPSMRFTAKLGKNVILPLLVDVPGFAGIRIHVANFATQILGCIAVGDSYQDDAIWNSTPAFNALFKKIETAIINKEKVLITIVKNHVKI